MPIASKTAAACVLGLGVAVSLCGLATVSFERAVAAQPADPVAFTIPAEDGYGIADCMAAGNACGAAMAASWCEAHGHAKTLAFGAADVTGTTPGATGQALEPGAMMIRCGD